MIFFDIQRQPGKFGCLVHIFLMICQHILITIIKKSQSYNSSFGSWPASNILKIIFINKLITPTMSVAANNPLWAASGSSSDPELNIIKKAGVSMASIYAEEDSRSKLDF